MSEQNDDAVNGETVESPAAVDLSAMTETEVRAREAELRGRYEELKAKDKTVAELAELGDVTRSLNEAVAAVNMFATPGEDAAEIVADIVPETAETVAETAETVEATETAEATEVTETTETVDRDLVAAAAEAAAKAIADHKANATSSNDDANGGLPAVTNVTEVAPIVAAAAATNGGASDVLSMGELGAALETAMHNGAGRGGDVVIASVNPYGNVKNNANALGSDPAANHAILHPDNPDYLSVTAAVGCAPAEPSRVVPSCFDASEPVLGTLTNQQVQYGQVQLYDPSCLDPDMTGLMIPGPECGPGCVPSVELECAEVDCIKPKDPVKVIPVTACICVPDDLQFSAPYVLDDQLNKLSAGFAKGKELWRLQSIREQSIVRQFTPPYGANAGVAQAALQIAALVKNNQRCGGTFEDYQLVYNGGDALAALADKMNRTWGVSNAMDDLFGALQAAGVSDFVEIIEHDDANSTTAAGPRPVIDPTLVGNANAAPLEAFYQTPTFYLYKRSSFITGSPFSTQLGFGDREKEELASGCSRMIMREYWLPPTHYGCSPSFVLDFNEFCASGSGPDRQTPVCAGAEDGGSGPALP